MITSSNFIDNWFIELPSKFDGWGMLLYVLLTLTISALCASAIGLERYRKGENAGMRTHALLSIGCTMLMVISIWAIRIPDPNLDYDISRIAASAVTGIGFLGAGVIIKDKFTVEGLSTATTLWICSAIGLATGAGFVVEGVAGTIFTLIVIFIRNRVIVFVDKNAPHVTIKAKREAPVLEIVKELCSQHSLNLKNIDIISIDKKYIIAKAYFPYHINTSFLEYFIIQLSKNEDIISAKLESKENNKYSDHES